MINHYTAALFTGWVTTLDGFIEHCMRILESDDQKLRPNIPEPDRESLIKKAERIKKAAEIKRENIIEFDDGAPYALWVNGEREVGLRIRRDVREERINSFRNMITELEKREAASPRFKLSQECEIAKQQLLVALVTVTEPVEAFVALNEEESREYLLQRLQNEIDTAQRMIESIKSTPEIELPRLLEQFEIAEARLRPFDIGVKPLGITGFDLPQQAP